LIDDDPHAALAAASTRSEMNRRALLAAGAGGALLPIAAMAATPPREPRAMQSAASFGATGDGVTDDTAALQAALDTAFRPGGTGFLVIPPGTYRVGRTLRISLAGAQANVTHHSGIQAHGARLLSTIGDGQNVFEVYSRATVRFLLIEGLDISGSGHDGHGILLDCDANGNYLYNFCLRDVVVQNCGGDGCRLIGNVFEGQIFNSYFRGNHANGATFGHGPHGGILSAMHVFGCVFGENGKQGVELINGCYDVSMHGCYLLLNGEFGLSARNGCTLLSNCGFENNHRLAADFVHGDAGMWLQGFSTLIGCTAYSIFNQSLLLRCYLTSHLVMIGCAGFGGGKASMAGLAKIGGTGEKANATLIGCSGAIEYINGFEATEIGGGTHGARFGSRWQGGSLLQLGDYRLWVDGAGKLRMKRGAPGTDEDGAVVGG
jgi:hypothetical protein